MTFTEYINGSNERVVVTSQIVQRTIQQVSTEVATVLDDASTLAIGNAYGSKQFSTVDVSQAAVNATFSLSKIVNSYNSVNAAQSTLIVDTALGTNTVSAVNISGATREHTYS
ncbi:MAG: hypothetical protein O3B31_08010 [Chloroflexi bacterium]|nr:hypothetical protein [Chloroflexota bacterium]MDA1003277.1 hypothetical protein [Chloroflexota bacterium]